MEQNEANLIDDQLRRLAELLSEGDISSADYVDLVSPLHFALLRSVWTTEDASHTGLAGAQRKDDRVGAKR